MLIKKLKYNCIGICNDLLMTKPTRHYSIHAVLLAQAFTNISCIISVRGMCSNTGEPVIITYKNEKIPMANLKITDNLKKYTLSESREIAYLVYTHPNILNEYSCSPTSVSNKKN